MCALAMVLSTYTVTTVTIMTDEYISEEDNPHASAETLEAAREFMKVLVALMSGESNTCPHCGESTKPLRQVGRSVYGACGCRLYQGKLPNKPNAE